MIAACVEYEQDVRGNVSQAAELLGDAVFEHEDVVEFERRVVMAVSVKRDDRQADFFSENANGLFLIFLDGYWWRSWLRLLRGRIAKGDCQQEKPKGESELKHGLRQMLCALSWFSAPVPARR